MNDGLTGLYSRAKFFDVLGAVVQKTLEYGAPVALLIVDIRQFHKINENFGHRAGDTVLQAVAGVLKQVRRDGDYLARIGDDQFALLLARLANAGHAQLAALKIQRLLDVPISVGDRDVRSAATIGISLCPSNASDADTLLQSAEFALQQAKYQNVPLLVSEKKPEERISDQWDVEVSLGDSITRSELRVFFQPKISLDTGKPVGAEALIRWESQSRGLVSPDVFMPVAEAIGFLKPMTVWMLNSALRLSSNWTRKWGRLSVSVNIPPQILEQSDFVDLVTSAEKLWQRENMDLCLEVVEQSLVTDVDGTFDKLSTLRGQGVKVSIDDFGTGYSSLSYFRDLPTDELKIDQSFVRGLKSDKANVHIVSLIIEIAHRFGLKVVAEGVENRDVLMYLKKKGCDQAQGYFFAKPLPPAEFAQWLNTFQPDDTLTG